MESVGDIRPDPERGKPIREAAEAMAPEFAAMENLPRGIELARKVATAHANALDLEFAPLRQMVMGNNVGLIRFESVGTDDVAVIHTLLSSEERGYPEDVADEQMQADRPLGVNAPVSEAAANTVVRVELIPPAPREPALNPGAA